ncbi:MAG: FemAB, partial [Novosphingobium sp.]
MNAPFRPSALRVSVADLTDPGEQARIERFVGEHAEGTPFHRPAWLLASARGTGNKAHALLAEHGGEIAAYLPLTEIHSPIFGRMLASSGFAVGGGLLAEDGASTAPLFRAVEELALRLNCPTIELRGGTLPQRRAGWAIKRESHCGFVQPLAADDEAQLLQVPRKQRAEVRKGLSGDLTTSVGTAPNDRAVHYAVYAES